MVKRDAKKDAFIRKWLTSKNSFYVFTHLYVFEGNLFLDKCVRYARKRQYIHVSKKILYDGGAIKLTLTNHGKQQLKVKRQ